MMLYATMGSFIIGRGNEKWMAALKERRSPYVFCSIYHLSTVHAKLKLLNTVNYIIVVFFNPINSMREFGTGSYSKVTVN